MPTIRITTEETHGKLMVAEEALGAILSFDLTTFLQASSIVLLISSFFFSAKASGCRRSGRVPSKLSKYEFASQQLTFETHLLQGVLRLTTDFVSEYLYLIFHQERKSETSKPLSPAASKYHLISSYYETFRI